MSAEGRNVRPAKQCPAGVSMSEPLVLNRPWVRVKNANDPKEKSENLNASKKLAGCLGAMLPLAVPEATMLPLTLMVELKRAAVGVTVRLVIAADNVVP